MPTRSTRTRLDDQRKNHVDTKGPKQSNRPKQLQAYNLHTNGVKNINSASKGRDSVFANKPRVILWGAKRILQRSRGNVELLYIDQHILNESKTRRKNLAMAWIDYKKAYDMVPQSWLINCLKMYKISHEVINFVEKTKKTWRVELTTGSLSLSPLLFVIAIKPLNHRKCTAGYKLSRSQEKINHPMYMDDIKLFAKNKKLLETLIHAVRIYSQDLGIEFGIEKCAMLLMKSG